jgi:hypothetical protein
VATGVHLDQRGGLPRLDQPQRGCQQRVHQHVVPDQSGLVGGATQQPHHQVSLRRVGDGVDHRQVLLRGHREQLRHPGELGHWWIDGMNSPAAAQQSGDNDALLQARLIFSNTLSDLFGPGVVPDDIDEVDALEGG